MADLNPLKFAVAIQDEATQKLNDIQTKLNSIKDQKITVTVTGLEDLRALLSALQHQMVNNLGNNVSQGVTDALKTLRTEAQEAVRQSLSNLADSLATVKEAIQHDNFTAFSKRIEKCAESVNTLDAAFKQFNVTIGQDQGMRNFMTGLGEVIRNVRSTMGNLNAVRPSGGVIATEQYQRNSQRIEDALYRIQVARSKVGNAIKEGEMIGMPNVSNMRIFMQFLEAYEKKLRNIKANSEMMNGRGWQPAAFGAVFRHMMANAGDFQKQVDAFRRSGEVKTSNAAATRLLTDQERQLAMALRGTTHEAKSQSQILSDLKMLATQYLGVWGGQQFLNNIIQIGGQLEMQRLSIGAILQNQAQANDLFNKIKGLATQSPFGVVELDQMTKQLTAYGFKYNELFDMTKRLADISAATGTGVDRLALALGHVRSEAALSGYTLRQFAMGNVPMLQKLSEKLGKTTEEIRKMVRAKQITYDDVVGVLKDLTDEGGMFHNMQEVISQSVKAKFKNVRDAMDIMYGEMAEGDIGDALKEVAEVLMDVTKNWKDAATVLGTGTAMWALHRVAVLANIATLGEHNAATLKSIAAFRAQEAQQLRTASMYRVLSSAEKSQIATSKLLTVQERLRLALHIPLTSAQKLRIQYARQQMVMDQALAISEKKLTTEAIARQVATGKLTKAEAVQIITLADLTAAERIAALEAVNGTRKMNFFTMGLVNARNAAMRLGTALKSIIFNPSTLMMAGVTAIMELWQRNSREMEAAEELSNKIYEHSQEALKNTRQMFQDTGIKVEWRSNEKDKFSDVTGNFGSQLGGQMRFALPEFDTSEVESSIDRWTQYIRDYAATPNRILNEALFDEAGNVRSLKEQFDNLKEAVKEVAIAQEELRVMGDIFENAVNATNGSWFDDSVMTNISDYDKTLKSFGNNVAATYKKFRINIDIALQSARQQSKEFDNAISGMATYAQQLDFLVRNQEKYAIAAKTFRNANSVSRAAMNELSGDHVLGDAGLANVEAQRATMMEDLETFYIQLQADLETKGIKIGSMSEAQQQALLLGYKDKLSSIQGLSEETSNFLMKEFAKRFGIEIDVDDEKFRVKESEVKRLLKELSESDWNVEINFATNVKDVIDEARKQYKAAKEYFEKVKPIMLKLGVEFETGTELTEEQIEAAVAKAEPQAQEFVRNALRGVNEATKIYNNAMAASKAGGFALEDDKKNKKTGGTKAYQDEFAKRWDERIRIMKEAYGWYEKWEKKVGNDSAIAETNSKYGDIFREWKTDKVLPMDFDVTQIADYQRYVEKIRDDALARYQQQKNDKTKKNGEEALRVYRQAVALLNDIKFDNFVLAADQFKSTIDKTIDNLNTRWEMLNSVRTATGDEELAFTLSGLGLDENARNSAEAMKNELGKQLSDIGGQSLLDQVLFSADYDEERVRKMFKNLIPDDSKAKIDGLVQAYVEWQKLQKQVLKADVNTFANLIGSAVDLQSQVVKINEEYKQIIETLDRLKNEGQINDVQYTRGVQIASANREMKLIEASVSYKLLVDGVVTMNKNAAQKIRQDFINAVTSQLRSGAITAKEYADRISEINDRMQELESAPSYLQSYMQGGLNGIFENLIGRGRSGMEQGGMLQQEGQALVDQYKNGGSFDKYMEGIKKLNAGNEMAKAGDGMQKMGGKMANTVAVIDMIVHGIDNLVQGLKGTYDEIREMYEALGSDTKSDGWEDWNTFFSSFSAASSSATKGWDSLKNGDVGGVIEGVVGSFTNWVTGFAQGHDQKNRNLIEAMQLQVNALEQNTEAIKGTRERTLGYDNGELLRQLAGHYVTQDGKWNAGMYTDLVKGIKDKYKEYLYLGLPTRMSGYYGDKSSDTGYKQELDNLKEERDKIAIQWAAEAENKNSSEEALAEYEKKIAELDEQIHYFSEDLARDLWGIDIKGWADQFSDAFVTAFENGENAMKAFNDTAKSIMQSVASEMLKIGIIEPMIEKLRNRLFGYTDSYGTFHNGTVTTDELASDPVGSSKKLFAAIGDYFKPGGEGSNMMVASQEFLTGIDNLMKQMGYADGLRNSDSSSTLSAGIQGVKEETADLLAGYVNALRQDVSINRILLTQFVAELWPSYVEMVSSAVRTLGNVDQNVDAIRSVLSENGALFSAIDSIKSHFDNITNGNEFIGVK